MPRRGRPRRDGRKATTGPSQGLARPERAASFKGRRQEEREWAERSGPVSVRHDPSIVKPRRPKGRKPAA